jgi:hypothetical protein
MSRVFDTGRAGETSYDVAPAGAEFSRASVSDLRVDTVCGGDW